MSHSQRRKIYLSNVYQRLMKPFLSESERAIMERCLQTISDSENHLHGDTLSVSSEGAQSVFSGQ